MKAERTLILPAAETAAKSARFVNVWEVVRAIDALPRSQHLLLLMFILVLGLLMRMPFISGAGLAYDMALFAKWFHSALDYPPSELYSRDRSINYPPAYALILELTTVAYRWFAHGGHDGLVMRTLIKTPAIAFDLFGAVVAYLLVRRYARPAFALAAAAIFAFDPAIIYISAYWGQLDSVPAALALTALLLLLSGSAILAWPILVFAALVKPPVLILAPLFALYPFVASTRPERTGRLVGAGAGILLTLGLTEALALEFFPNPTLVAPLQLLVRKLYEGSSLYPYTSLNALNVFAIFHRLCVSDRDYLGPFTVQHWYQAVFVVLAVVICRAYTRRRSPAALLEASVLLFLAFFLFMPEMHERYQLYATMFAGVLIFRKPYAIAAATLSATLLLSLERSMAYANLVDAGATGISANDFEPWLMSICGLVNLGVFVWLLARYGSPLQQPSREQRPAGS